MHAKHIGFISVLALTASLLPYIGDVPGLGSPYLRGDFFAGQAYHELCMLVLIGPVIYASTVLRVRGGVAVSIAESLAVFPHELYFSSDPDPLFRLAAFAAVSMLLAGFIGSGLNKNEQLQQEHARLEQFLSQTIDTQERERRYLARELHDEAAQALVDISHRIDELIETRYAASIVTEDNLRELRGHVEAVLEGTRRFIRGLRPPLLEEMGLGSSLRWLAQELSDEQGIEVSVDVGDAGKRLSAFQEMNLFRIAQEALNNARKHSQASRIWLSLAVSDNVVQLRVKDNGIGFAVPTQERLLRGGKFGLIGIMERVRLARGTVRFESAHGRGTTVAVKMPTLGSQSQSGTTEHGLTGPLFVAGESWPTHTYPEYPRPSSSSSSGGSDRGLVPHRTV